LPLDADDSFWSDDEAVTVGFNSDKLFRWYMNSVSMEVEWDNPSLLQVYNNASNWTDTSGVVELTTANEWAYVIISTDAAVPHPSKYRHQRTRMPGAFRVVAGRNSKSWESQRS